VYQCPPLHFGRTKDLLDSGDFDDDFRAEDEPISRARDQTRNRSNNGFTTRARDEPFIARPPVFDLSRKLADLAKLYDSSMKYKAELYDVFDSKFIIFRDCCQKVGIGEVYMNKAFSLMLDGKAVKRHPNLPRRSSKYGYQIIIIVCRISPTGGR
jgi:hypothetical protein